LSLEWKSEGVMDGDSGDERNDDLKYVMRVISSLHDQQAGEVPWEADSRDAYNRPKQSDV